MKNKQKAKQIEIDDPLLSRHSLNIVKNTGNKSLQINKVNNILPLKMTMGLPLIKVQSIYYKEEEVRKRGSGVLGGVFLTNFKGVM